MYQVTDEQLSDLLEQYAEIYRQVESFESALDALKSNIKVAIVERGSDVSHVTAAGEIVTARYRNGFERVSWNKEGLLELAETEPLILEHMKVSWVGPTLNGIKVSRKV